MRKKLLAGIGAGLLALALATPSHAATETLSETLPAPLGVVDSQIVRDFTSTTDGTISKVAVTVDFIAHDGEDCALPTSGGYSFPGELDMRLVSPMGTVVNLVKSWVTLQSNHGTYTDYDVAPSRAQVTFDDNATTAVGASDNLSPVTGTFRPVEPLSVLQGEDAAGVWQLVFSDVSPSQAKCYYGASLMLETAEDTSVPSTPGAVKPPAKIETAVA